MKIIDMMKKEWSEYDIKKALSNISGFDYTQFEDTEIFEAIKQKLIENKCFACDYYTSIEKYDTTIVKSYMNGKILYPEIIFDIHACLSDNILPRAALIRITPYECDAVTGSCIIEWRTKKFATEAIVEFMTKKFGKAYTEKRSEQVDTTKSL